MSSVTDAIQNLYPNFREARRHRREVRQRLRKNLKALDRGDKVFSLSKTDYELGYLGNSAEKRFVEVDHLIQKTGSQSGTNSYKIKDNSCGGKLKDKTQECIESITRQNWISIITEIIFTIFVIVSFSAAISVGVIGIEGILSLF